MNTKLGKYHCEIKQLKGREVDSSCYFGLVHHVSPALPPYSD